MNRLALTFGLIATVLANGATAQFPEPDIEALEESPPVPARLPDGRPNWTGFWITPNGLLDVYRGPGGLVGQPPGLNTRSNRPAGIPPLKEPWETRYEEALRQSAAGELPDPVAACYPPGMPRMMVMIYGMEILQTPNIISITSEWGPASRRIWMGLDEHPPLDELDPTYMGHTIGRWDGDTLVIDTVGVREDVPLDFGQLPHSSRLRIIERFTQVKPGVLVNEITVEDPEVFEGPWTYSYVYVHRPEFRLQEFVCLENNRNVDADGRSVFE